MKITALLFVLVGSALAQDSPRINRTALWASIAARTADTGQTCYNMATVTPWHERTLPVHTCGGVALWNGGTVLASFAGQKVLHRTGHHRLESLPNWISFAGSVAGIAYTLRHTKY